MGIVGSIPFFRNRANDDAVQAFGNANEAIPSNGQDMDHGLPAIPAIPAFPNTNGVDPEDAQAIDGGIRAPLNANPNANLANEQDIVDAMPDLPNANGVDPGDVQAIDDAMPEIAALIHDWDIPNQALAIPNPAAAIWAIPNPAGAVPRRRIYHLNRPVIFKHPTRVWSEQELAEVLCSICHKTGAHMKRIRWPVSETSCGHKFCIPCIERWRKRSRICPLCNQLIVGKLKVFHLV